MKTKQNKQKKAKPVQNYPPILARYVHEVGGTNGEGSPRRITRKFHGLEIPGWAGRIHVEDVRGWVENKRLKLYLSRWRNRRGNTNAVPTTDELYDIMREEDQSDGKEAQRVCHLDRLARSIARNGVQEAIIVFLDENGNL